MRVEDKVRSDSQVLTLNPDATVRERRVGRQGHKVVIVDDLYADFAAVQAAAASLTFSRDKDLVFDFPGDRSSTECDTRHLVQAIAGWYGKETPNVDASPPFVVSRSNAGVWEAPSQRQPHTDDAITSLVYLNSDEECAGGTALYRHVSTGLEWLPFVPNRQIVRLASSLHFPVNELKTGSGYHRFARSMIFNDAFAAPYPELIGDGNTYWELMDIIEMKPNRLVIFDGRIPHSMYQRPDQFIDARRIYQLISLTPDATSRPSAGAVLSS